MVGAVAAAGFGEISSDDVRASLSAGRWDDAGPTRPQCAPAAGLMLEGVDYGKEFRFEWEMDGDP